MFLNHRLLVKYTLLFSLTLLILQTNCGAQDSGHKDIVAKIGNSYTISFDELRKYVDDNQLFVRNRRNKAKAYDKGIKMMVIDGMKIVDFFDRGLNKNKELLQEIRRSINEALAIRYYETQFYGKYINDNSIKKAYKNMGREVIYRQIVLKMPKNATLDDVDSLKTLANDLKTKIDKGADFGKLVKRYSQDNGSSLSGGLMPAVNWKASLSNTFDYLIFNLVNGEVLILEKGQSIYIVKVTKINKTNVQPFEKVKGYILRTLNARYADFCIQEFNSTKNALIDERNLEWNHQSLEQLVKWSSEVPAFFYNRYVDSLQAAIANGNNPVVLKHSAGIVDFKELLRLLNEVLVMRPSSSLKDSVIKGFILEALRTDIIVKKAEYLDLEKDVFRVNTADPVLKDQIIMLYKKKIIESQIPEATEEALNKFYQENKDSLFYQQDQSNICAIIDSDRETLDALKPKIDQNIPFERLAPTVSVKSFIRDRYGVVKSYSGSEKPFLGEAALKLELNEVAGPIEYTDPNKGKQYALIKCIVRHHAKQLQYSEVEKNIRDVFKNYYRDKLEKKVEEQLRKKYPVIIYEDVLKKNLASVKANMQ